MPSRTELEGKHQSLSFVSILGYSLNLYKLEHQVVYEETYHSGYHSVVRKWSKVQRHSTAKHSQTYILTQWITVTQVFKICTPTTCNPISYQGHFQSGKQLYLESHRHAITVISATVS